MEKEKWIWMPHAGHFIFADRCLFRLNTYVGKYVVSTVGEMEKNEIDLKFHPIIEGDLMSRYTEIGCGRKYETMVFKAQKTEFKCCPYKIIVQEQVDQENYNSDAEAMKGHLKLCKKWSNK